ncbi:ParB/RepB/Spo0J family partition protein [Papillibacter cinnamivorans]|uniref:Chromosome partitioning protein, ParB family n=1 Tax=Papillibacter cinnamivorans DSM 12816 TaxID=1122930 RepID=A0A1W2A9L9_9FIRM|nr:ParB/RepB/Spo0J family partition protein [Papillibacter cinnamivorans]SMC56948.1 chromosome partitioning protein, ParB family [Papillibacter cinnamivorans DSM 12816]
MQLGKKRDLFDNNRILYIKTSEIFPNPSQPRRVFDEAALRELADSITQHGILQPLSIRRCSGGYELIAGERRLRAAKLARLDTVPCLLMGVDNQQSTLLALVENLQRRDLDFMEEASALFQLIQQYGLSQEEAAQKIGKSQSAVANKLRLLRLSTQCLSLIQENNLSERHARALLRLDKEQDRLSVLEHITANELNVSESEEYIERYLQKRAAAPVQKKLTYVIRDVRFFLNTVSHGVTIMKMAGIDATYGRTETADDITITIKIPKESRG